MVLIIFCHVAVFQFVQCVYSVSMYIYKSYIIYSIFKLPMEEDYKVLNVLTKHSINIHI